MTRIVVYWMISVGCSCRPQRRCLLPYRIFRFDIEDGKGDAPPVVRVKDWEPNEVSIVAAGADPSAFVH